MPGRDSARDCEGPSEAEIIAGFNSAIKATTEHVKACPQDLHQLHALRRAKSAVLRSFEHGNSLSLGALHSLKGVGHWVVQQVPQTRCETRHTAQGTYRAISPHRFQPALVFFRCAITLRTTGLLPRGHSMFSHLRRHRIALRGGIPLEWELM